ncbi:hypothetical protein [Streptomyces solincola]|uniref:hypothetical protein n=1 Tax=Streptomyces solincola TaxID=2100817 RepID=UPI0026D35BC7
MARRPLPRFLRPLSRTSGPEHPAGRSGLPGRLSALVNGGGARIARGRQAARTAADGAADVLQPLITVGRGLRKLAAAARVRWAATPKERRGPTLFVTAACVLAVAMIPYGPVLALIGLMGAAGWQGRRRPVPRTGPTEAETARLASLYEALVPLLSVPEDPAPLFRHGGEWSAAFSDAAFDGDGRISRLLVAYPAYLPDGDPGCRARVERVLRAKSGRGREYLFDWDEEGNKLLLRALEPLPTSIAAQRFVTAPGETVLGFTDAEAVARTVPVWDGDGYRDAPPVVWRTGPRSAEPHLLALGRPGAGATTLLRSIALQALHHGDVLIVDGGGSGEYACLTGRPGVLAVESGLSGARAGLEWAARETERRLVAADQARQAGLPAPEDARRPLWILVDRPSAFGHLAAAEGRPDPLVELRVPLRHGRAAGVTVVVGEQLDALPELPEDLPAHTRARVVLGPASAEEIAGALDTAPRTGPLPEVPPGRGFARLGTGPVLRLQVPATPDPYDDATGEAERQAVLALLPPREPELPGPAAPADAPLPAHGPDGLPADGQVGLPAEGPEAVRPAAVRAPVAVPVRVSASTAPLDAEPAPQGVPAAHAEPADVPAPAAATTAHPGVRHGQPAGDGGGPRPLARPVTKGAPVGAGAEADPPLDSTQPLPHVVPHTVLRSPALAPPPPPGGRR